MIMNQRQPLSLSLAHTCCSTQNVKPDGRSFARVTRYVCVSRGTHSRTHAAAAAATWKERERERWIPICRRAHRVKTFRRVDFCAVGCCTRNRRGEDFPENCMSILFYECGGEGGSCLRREADLRERLRAFFAA